MAKSEAREASKRVILELERKTLEAQLRHRRLTHDLARTEQDIADQRLDLYKAAKQAGR